MFFRNILLTVHKTLIPIGLELGEDVGKFPISISHKTLSHDIRSQGLRTLINPRIF